jgi:hypothetical protein
VLLKRAGHEAQDARIEQKRWAAIAAQRQYNAYQLFAQRWESKYKYHLGESCPKMRSDKDQLTYMLGLLSGLQAVTNDINSGGDVNVPKDIAGIVERSMACLDNTNFGVCKCNPCCHLDFIARADEGKPDPYVTLKQSMQIGEQKAFAYLTRYMRLQRKPVAMIKIRDALRSYAESRGDDKPVNPISDYLMQWQGS